MTVHRRRFLAPEVVQTSMMDCGPAALKCVLEGFGRPVSYGRLREACQTSVDGTSIDTLEEVAVQLGLEAEQIILPPDHLLCSQAQALPALVVLLLPGGLAHFCVVWRRQGPFFHVMDPATGREWKTPARLLEELYLHTQAVPAEAWREWAGSEEFAGAMEERMRRLGVPRAEVARRLAEARQDEGWHSLAGLDAAIRMTDKLVRAGGLRRGRDAAGMLGSLFEQVRDPAVDGVEVVPEPFWSVRPAPAREGRAPELLLRGAVLLRFRGLTPEARLQPGPSVPTLAPELAAALVEPPVHPLRELLRLVRTDGLAPLLPALLGVMLGACAVVTQALLLRSLIDLGATLASPFLRALGLAALLVLLVALPWMELSVASLLKRVGRRLEARLRIAFLEKLPRLGNHYFRSRPTSDMAHRGHALHRLRSLPEVVGRLVRATTELVATTAGIIWLEPRSAPLALLAAATSLVLPLCAQPFLVQRDLRVRTHAGALSRFYLDAFLGLVALRNHGAGRAVRREHEGLLVEWIRAGRGFLVGTVVVEAVQALLGLGLAAWLLAAHLSHGGGSGAVLLLVYWTLNLPALGQELALLAREYPLYRNTASRLLEPLGAPTQEEAPASGLASVPGEPRRHGVALDFRRVGVRAAGHWILDEVEVSLPAGAHVAIVGPSGAGKSSLVGLLVGLHTAARGELLVDGAPLDGTRLEALRQVTAWVDPSVHLWNRSLLENLRYGAQVQQASPLGDVLHQADLLQLLAHLPDGLQTPLGEGGGLVSGGEGQRVRFGRALLRPEARLVVLDEPFRGLDRRQRQELLGRARRLWAGATLLCITHDVGETLGFERVLVVEGGRIVEDGSPRELEAREGSRYRALLEAERAVREALWQGGEWTRLVLRDGQLHEEREPHAQGQVPRLGGRRAEGGG